MHLNNGDIYQKVSLLKELIEDKTFYLPAKVNFRLNQNIELIFNQVKKIEESRINIISHYGTVKEDGTYSIPIEKITEANKELDELLALPCSFNLNPIYLSWLKNIDLPIRYMNAINFMIIDDQEE